MNLPGWFQNPRTFKHDGRDWVTDGHMAMVGEPGPDFAVIKDASRLFAGQFVHVDETARRNGFVMLGGVVFCEHFIDLCAGAHPGVEWRLAEDRFTVVGFVDGHPVAVVTMNRGSIDSDDGRPKCTACGGNGKRECEDCEGSGVVECRACGHDSECEDCDGSGEDGDCAACGGDGLWKEAEAAE